MRRGLIMVCASVLVLGAFSAPALAASAADIYRDFAANGKITGRYSRAELEAALKNALAEGYGAPAGAAIAPAVRQQIQRAGTLGAQKQIARSGTGGTLPFTGIDLGLIAAGGGGLLLLGSGLRRAGRIE